MSIQFCAVIIVAILAVTFLIYSAINGCSARVVREYSLKSSTFKLPKTLQNTDHVMIIELSNGQFELKYWDSCVDDDVIY